MTKPIPEPSPSGPDPVQIAIRELSAVGRSELTLTAMAEAANVRSFTLLRQHGRLSDLLDAADQQRFEQAGRVLWRDALPNLATATTQAEISRWLDGRIVDIFKAASRGARRARTAALADTHGREGLKACLTRQLNREKVELEKVFRSFVEQGLRPKTDLTQASLLFLTTLHAPVFLDVHPRLTPTAARAVAQRYRRILHHAVLGIDPPAKSLRLPGTLGMDDVAAPELPALSEFGETVIQAAIDLLDEDGLPTIQTGPLAKKLGVNVARIYREVGDVATIDRYAQARRLIGAAVTDIDALREGSLPRTKDELRILMQDILGPGLGAGRIAFRRRRLSALGASFGRSDLIAHAATHNARAIRSAFEMASRWNDTLPLTSSVAVSALWTLGCPIGLAHVDLIADGHHEGLANFLVDEMFTDLFQTPPSPKEPKTLDAAVNPVLRRGEAWRTGPRNESRDALIDAAIARVSAKPPQSFDLSILAPEAGLTEVAAHYYFPTFDRLVDEAANEAANRVLQAIGAEPTAKASRLDVRLNRLFDLLLTQRDAIALQRFLSIPYRSSDFDDGRLTPRGATRRRFIDALGTYLDPTASKSAADAIKTHVSVLLHATHGIVASPLVTGGKRDDTRARSVIEATLLPSLRNVIEQDSKPQR